MRGIVRYVWHAEFTRLFHSEELVDQDLSIIYLFDLFGLPCVEVWYQSLLCLQLVCDRSFECMFELSAKCFGDNVNFRKKRASFSAGIDRCTKTSTTQTHHLSNPAAVLQLNHVQPGLSPPTPCSSLQRNDPSAPEVFPGKCVGCSAAPIHCTAKSTFFIIFHLDIIQMCNFIAQDVHICPNMWIACARHFVSHLT